MHLIEAGRLWRLRRVFTNGSKIRADVFHFSFFFHLRNTFPLQSENMNFDKRIRIIIARNFGNAPRKHKLLSPPIAPHKLYSTRMHVNRTKVITTLLYYKVHLVLDPSLGWTTGTCINVYCVYIYMCPAAMWKPSGRIRLLSNALTRKISRELYILLCLGAYLTVLTLKTTFSSIRVNYFLSRVYIYIYI